MAVSVQVSNGAIASSYHCREEAMLTHPKVGDYVTNTCRRCNKLVRSRLTLRNVELARTRLVVPDVLVDVCPECGHMISIAPEALPQLREAGCWK
jgi:hypothetical protein